jgi:hypothetical protein
MHCPPARGPRCCKLDGKDAVDVENGLVTEEEMRENVEYLVLGHFERKEGDSKGTHVPCFGWRS